jgi:hypothetical protein
MGLYFSDTPSVGRLCGFPFVITVLGLLAACANAPTETKTVTAATAPKERVEPQTGSNLPRKANKPSNVIVVDPEGVQGSARGTTRSAGSGP